jgi:hypothetical protein
MNKPHRLSDSALHHLQIWVAKEFIEACDNVEMYQKSSQIIMEDGNTIYVPADPQQVELWTQKRAMMEGIASALNELVITRKEIRDATEKMERIIVSMKS